MQLSWDKMFRKDCVFVAGSTTVDSIPESSLTEYAFIGRSNVGKSSLLNALVHRKNLAKISQNPGRTRQINFFRLANALMLVDLPGYGYARVSKSEKNQWDNLICGYLNNRRPLQRVFLLVDARHEIKSSDITAMTFLDECAVQYQVILTKIDKISSVALHRQKETIGEIGKKHSACHPVILACSSKSSIGIDDIRKELASTML